MSLNWQSAPLSASYGNLFDIKFETKTNRTNEKYVRFAVALCQINVISAATENLIIYKLKTCRRKSKNDGKWNENPFTFKIFFVFVMGDDADKAMGIVLRVYTIRRSSLWKIILRVTEACADERKLIEVIFPEWHHVENTRGMFEEQVT